MKPDPRKCSWSFLSNRNETAPEVLFTPSALKWIKAMVECHDGEVGFLGLVNEIGHSYVITEIFYPKHCLVSSATCEIAPEGEVEIAQKLIDENRVDDVARVRFWGHSHHTMGTSPSAQDDTQAVEKMNNNGAYFIRAICNRDGELSVSFFDHARQIKFENIKWAVYHNFDTMLQNVISAINLESQSREKVLAIRAAVSPKIDFDDDEYKAIVEKVKELKKTQLPAKEPDRGFLQAGRTYPDQYENFNKQAFREAQRDLFWPNQDYEDSVQFTGHQTPEFDKGHQKGRKGKGIHTLNTKVINNEPLLTSQEIVAAVNGAWGDQ
jgi:hypothetical protein